jgi:hypothetical protein
MFSDLCTVLFFFYSILLFFCSIHSYVFIDHTSFQVAEFFFLVWPKSYRQELASFAPRGLDSSWNSFKMGAKDRRSCREYMINAFRNVEKNFKK